MKTTLIVYSVMVAFLLGILGYFMLENTKLKQHILKLNVSIEMQNKTIKEQKIELENYICDIDSMKAYALKEYEKAFEQTKDDKTCEGRVKHLENILKSYED